MASIFKKDAQILTLQHEKIEQMQRLYDLEMKMYGRMSKLGNEIFEVQHCEIFNGRVREMTESERKEDRTNAQQADRNKSVHGKLDLYKKKTDTKSTDTVEKKGEVPER